jgi:hypothetical protein
MIDFNRGQQAALSDLKRAALPGTALGRSWWRNRAPWTLSGCWFG